MTRRRFFASPDRVESRLFLALLKATQFAVAAIHGNAWVHRDRAGAVAGLVGIECGVVSGVSNLESSSVEAPDWRPRHDEHYHEA
jgi:hypothetical protein